MLKKIHNDGIWHSPGKEKRKIQNISKAMLDYTVSLSRLNLWWWETCLVRNGLPRKFVQIEHFLMEYIVYTRIALGLPSKIHFPFSDLHNVHQLLFHISHSQDKRLFIVQYLCLVTFVDTGSRFLTFLGFATIKLVTGCDWILNPRGLCHCCGMLVHVKWPGTSFRPRSW